MAVGDPTKPLGQNPTVGAPQQYTPTGIQTDPGTAPSAYGGLWNLEQNAVINPAFAGADQSINNLLTQQGLLGADTSLQQGNLQTQLAQGLQGIGLSQQSLGIQQGALSRQMGPTGISQELENLQQQLFGISHADIGAQREQAQFQSGQQTRGAWSGATARGATNTSGFGQQLSDIQTQLQEQLGGIGREEQRLGVSEQQNKIQFGEQQAQLKDQQGQLDIASKRLGLSGDELKTRIGNALNQLGISQAVSETQIIQGINDITNGKYSTIANVIGQVAAIDPSLLPR